MKYLFESEDLSAVSIEKSLGLKRGDVKSVTIYPSGAVEVEVDDGVATDIVKGKILDELKAKGLPKGKKPKQ